MQKSDCYYLGNIGRRHGLKGHLILHLDTDQPELYKQLKSIFIDINGTLVPFIVSETKPTTKEGSVKILLENISLEEADTYTGKDVYLPLSTLPILDKNNFYFHEVIGYEVEDENHGEIGKIKSIMDHTAQALFVIDYMGKEILIPVHDDWIADIDRNTQKIKIKAPEGLIDLYLHS